MRCQRDAHRHRNNEGHCIAQQSYPVYHFYNQRNTGESIRQLWSKLIPLRGTHIDTKISRKIVLLNKVIPCIISTISEIKERAYDDCGGNWETSTGLQLVKLQ